MSSDPTTSGARPDAGATPAVVPETPASNAPMSATPAGEPARPKRRAVVYVIAAVVALLVLAVLSVYVWKAITVRRYEARLAQERGESSSAQRQALDAQARELLRLTARPLAWSVRAEMLRGNLGQVDDYFRELVRERGVASIILVDENGKIALATNRKLETQPAASVVSQALLETKDVASEESGSSLRLAVPVMAFDRRLGTLVVDYDLQAR